MKKLLATVLAASLLLCLLPTAAFAAGESGIQLGTAGLKANDEIYFGNYTESGTTYDVPWIVLSKSTNESFLLSKYLLGTSQFRTETTGYYSGGALNAYMDALYNGTGFTSQERGAIATVASLDCADGGDSSSPSVSNAHLYPLSFNEANALTWGSDTLKALYITNQGGGAGWWWLRSSYYDNYAFCVDGDGHIRDIGRVDINLGVRPAFNLNLNSVLFTSANLGGKSSGAVGAGALNSNLTPSTTSKNTWKLTLLDSSRSGFAITATALTSASAIVNYSGAKTGANEYISAMIVDNGAVAYYGRVKNLTDPADASGTVTVNIPSGVTLDSDTTLRVFNEQYNGDYNTDYSGALLTVTMPNVTVWPETLPAGMENTAYSAELTATNSNGLPITGEAAYSLASGALPIGLTLVDQAGNNGKATLSGTPALAGTYTFTVQAEVNDGTSKSVGQRTYTVVINPEPVPGPSILDPAEDTVITVTEGETGTMAVRAENALSFQWEIDRGSGWEDISGATEASYTTSAVALANDGYKYRCTVSGAPGTAPAVSKVFTLNVIENAAPPVTGDANRPFLWAALALLALAGLVFAARKPKSID